MYKEIGHNLRVRRLELGMTVADICNKLNIARSTWYRYEAGKVDSLTPTEIARIAKALHVDSLSLLGFDEDIYGSYRTNTSAETLPPSAEREDPLKEYASMGVAVRAPKQPYGRALTDQDVEAIAKRVVDYNNPPTANAAPRTEEARTVSFGMDKLPEETRKRIVGMIRAMFSGTPEEDYFANKEGNDDDA